MRDLGIDPRRILQIRARGIEHRWHQLLARDQRAQTLIRRRETSRLMITIRAVGDPTRIAVRILLPLADRLQVQQVSIQRGHQQFVVLLRVERQTLGIECLQPSAEKLIERDLVVVGGFGPRLELRVVLMESGLSAVRRTIFEESIKVVVDEFVPVGHDGAVIGGGRRLGVHCGCQRKQHEQGE